MHAVKLNIKDSVFNKVIYFLQNLPSSEIEIVENTIVEDWSHLEVEIDKGLQSGVSNKFHEKIISDIKIKYA